MIWIGIHTKEDISYILLNVHLQTHYLEATLVPLDYFLVDEVGRLENTSLIIRYSLTDMTDLSRTDTSDCNCNNHLSDFLPRDYHYNFQGVQRNCTFQISPLDHIAYYLYGFTQHAGALWYGTIVYKDTREVCR